MPGVHADRRATEASAPDPGLVAVWKALAWPGLEHLVVYRNGSELVADGALVALSEGAPVRLRYTLECDLQWRTRRARLESGSRSALVEIVGDGAGRWQRATGETIPELDTCIDVDIALTPFTNTLPIARLALAVGERRDLRMVYFAPPDFQPHAVDQRYTCLRRAPDGAAYRYESGTFSAELIVDKDDLVTLYPGLWERLL
jgi:hypothetical protein